MKHFILSCIAFCALLTGHAFAQSTTINTTVGSTGYTGTNSSGTNGFITFVIENTSGMDIILTDVGNWTGSGHNGSTATLWYSTTSLGGLPALAPPVWNQVASATITGLTGGNQVNNVISGMNFTIPNGAIWRFALHNNTGTNHYSGPGGVTPNTFMAAGVTLRVGDYQIGGQNVGYGATNNPRFFTGSITFKPAGLPCTGVPTTEIEGPTETCPDLPFELRLQPTYQNAGFIWEKSTDGFAWAPATGAVSQIGFLTDVIKVPTWYRVTITCTGSGLSFTSPPYLVDISKFYYCYCENGKDPAATPANKVNIGSVKIAALPANETRLENITITGSQVNNADVDKDYSDFRRTLAPVKMYRDSSFSLEVNQFNSGNALTNAVVAAFLDYDRDGIFQYYERIHISNTLNAPVPGRVEGTFTISDTAHLGITGLRIIIADGNSVPDSCGFYPNGETEDYLVDIRYEPCTGPVNPGIVAASDTSMCPGYRYSLVDTTYESQFSELSRLWQMSADERVWNNIPGSQTKDSLMRVFNFNQPFYYRMRLVCEATGDTSYSEPVRVNNKPGYKCYCFSRAEGGRGLDTSDLGGLRIGDFDLQQGGSHLRNPLAHYARKDFTDLPPIYLVTDSTYTMEIAHTMPGDHHGSAKITVFMDFNNNHKYDIPEDRVFMGFTGSSSFVLHPEIHIPANAITEVPTGMRIIINNDISPNTPSDEACGTYLSGETEDYIVIFRKGFPTNINELDNLSDMQLYPNPTTGKFRLAFLLPVSTDDVHLTVTNFTGQKVFTNTYNHQGGRFSEEIDMNGAAPGVYFVELEANGQKQVKRLTVR